MANNWEIQVQVTTPEGQVLHVMQTLAPSYMDWGFMEGALDGIGAHILKTLDARDKWGSRG